MSLSHLKQLFIVGFLGLALTACSSGPEVNDAEGQAAEKVSGSEQASSVEQAAAESAAVDKGADMAAKAADLLAQIQGKVVRFDFDRSEIKTEYREIIKLNADYLSMNKEAKVTLEGHCDERGTQEYNLALGERRASAVKNALIAEGISPSRITIISFGEEKPVDAAHNESAWTKNRRTEFVY